MSELRPQNQARLRRAFRYIDEEAPLSPGLDEIGAPAMGPARPGRANSWWVAAIVFAGTLLLAVPVVLVMNSGNSAGPLGAPAPPTEASPTTTTTTTVETPLERLPLDGRPGDLGVESLNFVSAVFPASIKEIRMHVVWETARYNVQLGWVESCMEERGFEVEIPRALAFDFRRQAAIPDFELDAEFGFHYGAPEVWTPAPPAGSTPELADAWDSAYLDCSDEVEVKLSTQFDQVLGRAPAWFDIVDVVTLSPEMRPVTEEMLRCIADAGGPDVGELLELYSDRIAQEAESFDAAVQAGIERAKLIYQCAGDYDSVREGLLIPKRASLLVDHADVLAEAEVYFNEVMAEAGISVNG